MKNENMLKVGIVQIAPVWLNKKKTIEKIEKYITDAVSKNCELIVLEKVFYQAIPSGCH